MQYSEQQVSRFAVLNLRQFNASRPSNTGTLRACNYFSYFNFTLYYSSWVSAFALWNALHGLALGGKDKGGFGQLGVVRIHTDFQGKPWDLRKTDEKNRYPHYARPRPHYFAFALPKSRIRSCSKSHHAELGKFCRSFAAARPKNQKALLLPQGYRHSTAYQNAHISTLN